MKTTRQSQTKIIADELLQGKAIINYEAVKGRYIGRIPARIYDLKKLGFDIEKDYVQRENSRVAMYRLKVAENN